MKHKKIETTHKNDYLLNCSFAKMKTFFKNKRFFFQISELLKLYYTNLNNNYLIICANS